MSMRGASAQAYADLRGALDEVLTGADAAQVAGDLFKVAQLLRSEPALRRVATDLSLATSAKQGLVRQLLQGKVGDSTVGLVERAVGHRWTGMRDLPDALEQLSEVAWVKSAGADSAKLSDELFAFGEVLNDSPELRSALSDPARSVADKSAMLSSLLEGKALPATIMLVGQGLTGTYRTLNVALAHYQSVAGQVHNEKVATVRVAAPLSEADQRRLTEALSRQYSTDIHLNVVVDPAVIGGLRVDVGDDVIDGTVATRLDQARRKLAG